MDKVAQVIVPRPLPGALSYLVPADLVDKIRIGSFVQVPFRSKHIEGFVVDFKLLSAPELEGIKLKEVLSCPFEKPIFSKKDLDFFTWISEYYQLPLGEVFNSAFPKSVFKIPKKEGKKSVSLEKKTEIIRPDFQLTSDQNAALESIEAAFKAEKFKSYLLYGVTGSGKTEVYLRSVERALSMGKAALILVPEIALTPQLRSRFEDRFGGEVAVLHSGLSDKARREEWWRILNGEKHVVVGARSALFAPLHNIGLIVVDEEHEPSYKQEDRLRYSARDLALVRARQHEAIVILGSATPAIETYYAATLKRHELLQLRERPLDRPMPKIEIVDLKDEPYDEDRNGKTLISRRLRDSIQDVLDQKQQCMIFVNRKGFANFLLCTHCGEVPKCLNCSVSLTYYQRSKELKCNYCGLKMVAPDHCKACLSTEFKFMGLGTELIEDEMKRIFPNARIDRLDADVADSVKKIEEKLNKFREEKIDILVGTQMLAKGHDFPNVTLVGIILADLSLHLPDFRAAERTFQLVAQVAGRAGRGSKPGTVILQTYMPDCYVLQCAAHQDYVHFYKQEVELRKDFGYPPFSKIAQIEFRHAKEETAKNEAERIRSMLTQLESKQPNFSYLGPAAASIGRIANEYRWHILLKSEKSSSLNAVIKTLRKEGLRFIDVDPVSTL